MNIVIVGGLPESLVNFRGHLISDLVAKGHQVTVMAAPAGTNIVRLIENLGAKYRSYPVQRNGLNPIADLMSFLALRKAFKEIKPDIILAYTIKPVIWGGLAARFFCSAKFYGLITGLGFAFQTGGFKRNLLIRIVTILYRSALAKSAGVIFQNLDNQAVFVDAAIVSEVQCSRVYGSGVDVQSFTQKSLPNTLPVFLMIARLLGEKGVREYVGAAKLVKEKYSGITFRLMGPVDPSPDGIPLENVKQWHDQCFIEYVGEEKDVRPFLNNCHIYVLPSYHEGMPRTILEAMATARPILTADVSGSVKL